MRQNTSNSSPRWDRVKEEQESGILDILRMKVSIGRGNWKYLEEVTSSDADEISKSYARLETSNGREKLRYKRLGQKLREEGVQTVKDLPSQVVVSIMTKEPH